MKKAQRALFFLSVSRYSQCLCVFLLLHGNSRREKEMHGVFF